MSACILPVAPEFQDPDRAQNYPPQFVDIDPPIGSSVMTGAFNVVVRDPNNDPLYVRWLADYPSKTVDTRPLNGLDVMVPPPIDRGDVQLPEQKVECQQNLSTQLPFHRIQLIVADAPFVPPEDPQQQGELFRYERVPEGRYAIIASWIWNVQCRQ